MNAYAFLILVVLVYGPLVAMKGYRQPLLVLFYALVFCAVVGGIIMHYRTPRQHT